jgi:hypothetical protein
MKPKFKLGQRVRVVRTGADWDAPVGALGMIASYDGPNHRGTDWEVGFLPDGAEAFEPAWSIDESCLELAGPIASDPPPFGAHCLTPDGAWMDEIVTRLDVADPPDADARLVVAIEHLEPLLGGTPLSTSFSWHPLRDGSGDALMFLTTWCACRPWTDIVAPLRRRFADSCSIVDDGWAVEFHLPQDDACTLLGADAVEFRLFVDPWSSLERRPPGARYRLMPPPA